MPDTRPSGSRVLSSLGRWWRRLFQRGRIEADFQDQIQLHIAQRASEYAAAGLSPEEARRAALRKFGNVTLVTEALHDEAWSSRLGALRRSIGFPMIQRLSYDFRHAVRHLRRRPLLTFATVLVLALGIGPLTALSSLINSVLFRPWQIPSPSSMAVIRARPAGPEVMGTISVAEYRYLQQHSTTIAQMAASIPATAAIGVGNGPDVSVPSAFVNANYFKALRIGMMAGRAFVASDEDYSAPSAVAIISERLWRDAFGRDPSLVGAELRIAGVAYRIVGVAEQGFAGVERRGPGGTDVWMPLPARALGTAGPPNLARFADPRGYTIRDLAGRLNTGVTRGAAAAELSMLSGQFRATASLPAGGIEAIDTRPLSAWPPGSVQTLVPVYAPLVLAMVLVLLVACANVGNLLLADAFSRERDIAIRLSLGSSRSRIVWQLLMEAAVLSVAAAAVGLGLAFVIPHAMVALGFSFGIGGFEHAPGVVAAAWRPSFYAPDASVWLLTVLIANVTTVLAVLASAWRLGRVGMASLAGARHGRTAQRARLRFGLLAAQIAMSMVLLVGAATLTRATARVTSLNPGFTFQDVQVVTVQAGPTVRATSARAKAFFLGLKGSMDTAGLGPVAFSEHAPFSAVNVVMMARRPDEAASASRPIPLRPVSANYFAVLNISMVRGRAPASDTNANELVVNESAARVLWPDADPIGQTVLSAMSQTAFETLHVVGVARDTPVRSMSEVGPVIYRTVSWMSGTSHLFVRSSSPAVVDRVRAVAASFESDVTMSARPLSDFVLESLGSAVVAGRAAWGIGMLGLVLAIVGAFAVFAHEVQERRYEIGIRVAIGASARHVTLLLMRTARQSLLWGIGAGFLLSLLAVPIFRHFLYGLSPFDPMAYIQVGGILAVATIVATLVPIRRAISVDPAVTLRGE